MKNLQTFNEFLNESELNESNVYKALAKEYPTGLEDAWDESLKDDHLAKVEKALGAKAKDIQQIDEYSAEDSSSILKALRTLKTTFVATETIPTDEHTLEYDAKLNVTFFQDKYDGFSSYQITKKSKI